MASSPAVMVPDSTGHSIPIRTYAKKTKQTNISTIQEPTTRRKERKREFTIALVDERIGFYSV